MTWVDLVPSGFGKKLCRLAQGIHSIRQAVKFFWRQHYLWLLSLHFQPMFYSTVNADFTLEFQYPSISQVFNSAAIVYPFTTCKNELLIAHCIDVFFTNNCFQAVTFWYVLHIFLQFLWEVGHQTTVSIVVPKSGVAYSPKAGKVTASRGYVEPAAGMGAVCKSPNDIDWLGF